MPNIDYTPNIPQPSFISNPEGQVQGYVQSDPAIRNELATGHIISTLNTPASLWGGMAISETIGDATKINLGGTISMVNLQNKYSGISVFEGGTAGLASTNSVVPSFNPNDDINFYRAGSKARIALPATDSLITALSNTVVGVTQIYWDPVAFNFTDLSSNNIQIAGIQVLRTYPSSMNNKVANYDAPTRTLNWKAAAAVNSAIVLVQI